MKDWTEQLLPIILEYKDGCSDNLTKQELSDLVKIIEAKINLREGNISNSEYEKLLN